MNVSVSRRVRRVIGLAAVIFPLLVGGIASAEPDAEFPNLPATRLDALRGGGGTALAFVTPAQQWVRATKVPMAADIVTVTTPPDVLCRDYFKASDCQLAPGATARIIADALAYPTNHATPIAESTFFDFPAITVRTVAFGSVPVTATAEIRLPADADGLPVGLSATTIIDSYLNGTGPCPVKCIGAGVVNPAYDHVQDTSVSGEVDLRIRNVTIDGRAVNVGDRCWARDARLEALGKGYFTDIEGTEYYPNVPNVPIGSYYAAMGGELNGTLDVPLFSGCGSGSEDLSPMISTLASGKGFPLKMFQSAMTGLGCPRDESTCNYPKPYPFPSRD
ncbi:hypothetical protein FE697_010360 [Mumia zhuanghuii]|uniref:Uncharacterized protein n=2 Tax=Mumia TaxID=1546255 RepID=A0ABW1QQ78_9ACTN|nr:MULTISPECIES: hypothetical protein [Mumia]KAA1422590.1 hypothetical protein FE697_010360 [Mumia zhuanghuii]